jgi:prephenate dehydrogenase
MKVAVLGVGLIGGSIGLAARKRLEAEVAGYDPDRSVVDRALELGAIDRSADSVAAACEGAELVFCAAPVHLLAGLAGDALEATGDGTVVTDVGSTKRLIAETLDLAPRFVGGHPLAGAETAGVAHARADLFDGAVWYLTPGAQTSGELYERLHRLLVSLGARPTAIASRVPAGI